MVIGCLGREEKPKALFHKEGTLANSPHPTSALDQHVASTLRDVGGDELLLKIYKLLLGELEASSNIIDRLADEGDATALAKFVHSLRGACQSAGANIIPDPAARVEGSARSGTIPRAEIGALRSAIELTEKELRSFLHSAR